MRSRAKLKRVWPRWTRLCRPWSGRESAGLRRSCIKGIPRPAEELYLKALSIAREQQAKLWELRAAVSLARLRRYHGRRPEAHDLLAPVYGWFTEGFDTSELMEAKAVLGELD